MLLVLADGIGQLWDARPQGSHGAQDGWNPTGMGGSYVKHSPQSSFGIVGACLIRFVDHQDIGYLQDTCFDRLDIIS
jgi:hypothetical protein